MKKLILTALMLGVSVSAAAQELSYSYVQAGFQQYDFDDINVDGDGFTFGGSVALNDSWYIVGGYASADLDFSVDFNQLSLGAGYHSPLSNNTDWFAELAYVNAEFEGFGGSADDSGYGVTLGARGMLSPDFELLGAITHTDLGDGADGTAISVAGWYNVAGNIAVGLTASFDDDVTTYGIAGRLYFDR